MGPKTEHFFAHEKLEVYKQSLVFVGWVSALLETASQLREIKNQLDRASISIPLNIAEGNGKYTPNDRCRFFDIAHGSALECAAGLDVLVAKGQLRIEDIQAGKESLYQIVCMLIGLIKRNSDREYEKGSVES